MVERKANNHNRKENNENFDIDNSKAVPFTNVNDPAVPVTIELSTDHGHVDTTSMMDRSPLSIAPQQQTFYYKSNADQETIRTTLQKSTYFSCLDEEQMETFVQSVQLQQYHPGQVIITEGCIDTDIRSDNNVNGFNDMTQINRLPSLDDTASSDNDVEDHDESSALRQHHTAGEEDGNAEESQPKVRQDHWSPLPKEPTTIVDNDDDHIETTADTTTDNRSSSSNHQNGIPSQVSELDIDAGSDVDIGNHQPHKNDNSNSHWILSTHQKYNINSHDRNSQNVTNLESSLSSVPTFHSTDPPIPPQSGIPRSIYIIRNGCAQIRYQKKTPSDQRKWPSTGSTDSDYLVNTIGPGTIFGEGGFLFGRRHSASVIASTPAAVRGSSASNNNNESLECWVMDIQTFREFVLPSTNTRQIFHKYAQRHHDMSDATEHTEPLYVTINDLLDAINEYQQLHPIRNDCTNHRNFHLISTLYDSLIRFRLIASSATRNDSNQPSYQESGDAKIYLNDFCFFFALLARSDPEVDVIFLLMDEHQTGCIGIRDLQTILQPIYPELDFTSEFFQRYFGSNGDQYIRFKSFSQFLLDLQREIGQQAYSRAVLKGVSSSNTNDGYLSPNDFVQILSTSCGWTLPISVVQRLNTLYCHDSNNVSTIYGEEFFSYGDFMAFQDVLSNFSFICRLICCAEEFNNGPVSADDFKVVNREFGLGERLSRRQVDIIYDIFDLNNDGFVSHADIVEVCGTNFIRNVVPIKRPGNKLAFIVPSQDALLPSESSKESKFDLLQTVSAGMRNLCVATLIGGISVFLLHPIDMIKTRLMNQRKGSTYMYRGAIDCMQQVIRNEGFLSLFRGVQPHVLGVAIERSIKLQVHHLMQQAFHALEDEKVDNREPSLLLEALAGGCAGACQLLVTNPMEITSIRLQMYGETARLLKEKGSVFPSPSTMLGVVKDLGFPGVYRGASACLIRDVPFSAIFFPSYVACKEVLVQHNANFTGKATAADIFYAGTIAGIPASLLTTPADVVKCRLQSITRPGETSYSGIKDCVTKMYLNEGISAFFQGSLMRVLRIAPQFGLSLLLYENLTKVTGFDKARRPPSNLPIDPDDYRDAFAKPQPNEPGFLQKWANSAFSHLEA